MDICLIAAVAKNGVIGVKNKLPWHLPDDMKYFVDQTKGFPCIMGRKNWESIPEKYRPLKDRPNIILSRDKYYNANGASVFSELFPALVFAGNFSHKVFVIGGGDVYAQAIQYAKTLYLTEIDAEIEGDCVFPDWDRSNYEEVSRKHHTSNDRHKYAFDYVMYHNYNFNDNI